MLVLAPYRAIESLLPHIYLVGSSSEKIPFSICKLIKVDWPTKKKTVQTQPARQLRYSVDGRNFQLVLAVPHREHFGGSEALENVVESL